MSIRKYFFMVLILPLFCSSCSKELDLYPETVISEENFWETEKDLDAGVNAVYQALHGRQTNIRTFGLFAMQDVMSDIAAARTVSPFNAVSSGVYESNNNVVKTRWVDAYRGIIRANDVITHIQDIEAPESVRNERYGEVLFLRAWYYFNLVYFFGDIPLVLDVPTLDNANPPRTHRDTVLMQMHADLNEAITLLPAQPSRVGRASLGAALTLKAKLYMQELQYELAIPVLEDIMDLGYTLYPDYRNLFLVEGENNNEVIFDIQFTSQTGMDQGNRFNTMYGNKSMKAAGWSWLLPTKELIELYETTPDGKPDDNPLFDMKDPRMDMTVMRPGATFIDKNDQVKRYYEDVKNYEHAQTGMHCRKFVIEGSSPDAPFEGYWDGPQNFILFRYADVLLLYAEAMNEVYGPSELVYDAINEVRGRETTNMPPVENKTQGELQEIIRRERGVELALEGWRYYDLLRWGLLQSVNDGFEIVHVLTDNPFMTRIFTERNLLWPIPLDEIDVNPNLLPQNPGY